MTADLVSRARELRPLIVSSRAKTEEQRQLPEPIVEALRDSGLCRMALPTELGGLEADPLTALDVYEELAGAEASVAWVVWNSSLPCFFGRFLSEDARSELLGDARGMYASSTRPTGRAIVENGAYRVSGRWSLVSGCRHATTLFFMCLVEEDGEVRTMAEEGPPEMRIIYVPAEACRILDTWHVGGLRGTGSHDIVLDELQVDGGRSCSPFEPSQMNRPLGRIPIACTMSAGHAAICLGIARSALDTVRELGRTKVSVDPVPGLRDRPSNQRIVAETGAKLAAGRDHLHAALASLWGIVESGDPWTADDIGEVWSAAITASRMSRSAVDVLYEVAGTTSLYTDCTLERAHRDIHAAMQHIIAQPMWLEQAGAVKLGLEATHPLFTV
jgi:alkylation response protein AidB-like acyl-CoA dehydrogenase